jgi:hypothetical protein
VVGWLAQVGCGGFAGSLTSGGSAANLMGLAMAREAKAPANEQGAQPGVVYASQEVHMSVPKALALLGLGRANLRLVAVDDHFRMRPDALEAAIAEDRRAGRRAIAVVASAGTVTTGAIDPLAEVAAIAHANDLWLHVDGAYGALAALAVPERLAGLALADSLSVDAHKWLYQPLDCSALLYRDAEIARQSFAYTGDYAKSLSADPVEGFAFFEESIELSRRFRALKLWLSLRYHGLGQFRQAIGNDLRHGQLLAELIEAEPSRWSCWRRWAQRGVFPLDRWLGGDAGRAEPADPAAGGPSRTGLALQRDVGWPVRAAGLHRQPPHHRPGRRRGHPGSAGCRPGDGLTGPVSAWLRSAMRQAPGGATETSALLNRVPSCLAFVTASSLWQLFMRTWTSRADSARWSILGTHSASSSSR